MATIGVIGGGLGGIAAALRMRAKGHDVTIYDRCVGLGGRAQVFEKNGYIFDAGPTIITAPVLFQELFALFGKKMEDYITLVPLTPWYRFVFADGESFDYGGTLAETLEEVARISPADLSRYERFLQRTSDIFDIGYTQLADQPFHKLSTMIGQVPNILKFRGYRSMWKLVSDNLKDERLRRAFSIQPLLVGGNPLNTPCIYGLIHYLERKWGIYFAMGGTGALVQGLAQLMHEVGIHVQLQTTIIGIEVNNGIAESITTDKDDTFPVDMIISNADPTHLYRNLIPHKEQKISARIKAKYADLSMGLFVLYFGTARKYPDVAHHTIIMGDRYKELLKDIFKRQILADDFSMYLHRPTATDRSLAPEGHDCFYVLVPVPNLSSPINWSTEAQKFADKIIAALDRTILPGLPETIRAPFHMTPEDFAGDYLSVDGSGFSISPLLHQSAWFRYHNKGEGIKNLYLVGAGTHPGAGLPGVLSSAKVIDRLIN